MVMLINDEKHIGNVDYMEVVVPKRERQMGKEKIKLWEKVMKPLYAIFNLVYFSTYKINNK